MTDIVTHDTTNDIVQLRLTYDKIKSRVTWFMDMNDVKKVLHELPTVSDCVYKIWDTEFEPEDLKGLLDIESEADEFIEWTINKMSKRLTR